MKIPTRNIKINLVLLVLYLSVPKHMSEHNRSVTYLVSFNTVENIIARVVMTDFVGFVNHCCSSSDTLHQNLN